MRVVRPDLLHRKLVASYLRFLGADLDLQGFQADIEALRKLHRLHVRRIAYNNLDIQLGRPEGIGPENSVSRILRRQGGYCFHLNSAFGSLLASLGYDVWFARGAVPEPGLNDSRLGNHLVPLVQLERDIWIADVGMRDAPSAPVKLVDQVVPDAPFEYRVSQVSAMRWQVDFGPSASVPGFVLDTTPLGLSGFLPYHATLSSSPSSYFVRNLLVHRRQESQATTLHGRVLTEVSTAGAKISEINSSTEWFDLIRAKFGIDMQGGSEPRRRLWRQVCERHQSWSDKLQP